MNANKLIEILTKHKQWLNNEDSGERAGLSDANLRGADLRGANLIDANLRGANLRRADLSGANFSGADLRRADLRGADLRGADLSGADLRRANLSGANFSGADLSGADLSEVYLRGADLGGADLSEAYLRGADLGGANLSGANLGGANYDERTSFFALQCPEKGAFIGYKKAQGLIVELEILADAKRSSATSRKCRCSAAKVLSITKPDGGASGVDQVASDCDGKFAYRVGEVVRVDDFDDDRWNGCSTGIHFFITRDEAVRY